MMRYRCILAAAVLSVATWPAAAPAATIERVLADYYRAIGGLETWKSVTTWTITGRMRLPQDLEGPFRAVYARPLKVRLELTLNGQTGVSAYDGETAWAVAPYSGSTVPGRMTEEQSKIMREQADIEGPLIDWEAKGHRIELVGTEAVGKDEAYRLRVTLAAGEVRDYLVDVETSLPVRLEATTSFEGTEYEVETTFADYRPVGDLVMAHSIGSRPKGAPEGQLLTIDSVELDAEVDDSLFVVPRPESEPAAPHDSADDS